MFIDQVREIVKQANDNCKAKDDLCPYVVKIESGWYCGHKKLSKYLRFSNINTIKLENSPCNFVT